MVICNRVVNEEDFYNWKLEDDICEELRFLFIVLKFILMLDEVDEITKRIFLL